MTSGFGAVPDELRQTAGRIVDAVAGVAGMAWRGPSGDYGHPGVQAGWAQFIEEIKAAVTKLQDKAHEHGDHLTAAAVKYLESEQAAASQLGGLGELVDSLGTAGGVAAGGFSGGISTVLNGDDGAAAGTGFISPQVAARLNPSSATDGVPAARTGESGGQEEGPLF